MADVGVKLIVDNAALKKSFDEDIKLLSDMTRQTDQYNKTAVAGARAAIDAQREYGKQLGASLEQMRALDGVSQQLETKVSAVGERMATAAERGARGLSVMARQGEVTARSMNQIIAAGADIAFAFGPEGTIISAVLMVTAGIVAHFENAETKMEEAVQKFNHSLDEMLLNDSPIELAKDRARAYVEQLEASSRLVLDKQRETAKGFDPTRFMAIGRLHGFLGGDGSDQADVANAGAKVAGIDAAAALLAPVHAHDKEIDRLKKEEDQANAEVTTWRSKVDALKTDGKASELKVAKAELDHVTEERDRQRREINRLEQERINTAESIAGKMKRPEDAAQAFALANPIKDRGLTDFSEQDEHSDAAVSSAGASKRIAAMTRANAEADRLRKERQASEQRANELFAQMEDAAVQHQLMAHGLVEEAEKAALTKEFDRRADEISKLKVSEDRKAELLIAAARDRANHIEEIERKHSDTMRDIIAKEGEEAFKEYERGAAKQERAEEAKQKVLERILASSGEALVRGHGDLAHRILQAALAPEVKYLEGMAAKHYALAAKDAAVQNWIGAAEQIAGASALMAGAALVGSIGGSGGGGGASGGGGGGGGGGSSTATHLGATGSQSNGPLQLHIVVVHEDMNGREISRIAQKLQRLDDRGVPIRIGGLG